MSTLRVLMRVIITDHETANTIVSAAPDGLRAVVSIFSPPESYAVRCGLARGAPCHGFESFPHHKITLSFDDSIEPEHCFSPTKGDMQRFLVWAGDVVTDRDHAILFHCHAGISRSTAFALAFLMAKFGPGTERDAMEYILTVRPTTVFNELIVELADECLGLNGNLIRTVDDWRAAQKSLSVYSF